MKVIVTENLGKKYLLRHQSPGSYVALRDVLADGCRALGRRLAGKTTAAEEGMDEEFWALSDVCFEVEQGDRIGIIGRNGAGKSTLLKILSRITEPTAGSVRIRGRLASLLEVGTGFHPELTGRENIYLNGAVLGMGRSDIARKFDEIVSFAEVERFLDTPVKRYSSGMYMRLAFAVAAHLDPEILVVDEVLAVGDAQFQKKCLGRMAEVGKGGTTLLFVSHSMNAIEQLCSRALLLDQGRVKRYTPDVRSAVRQYMTEQQNEFQRTEWINPGHLLNNSYFVPSRFFLTTDDGCRADMPVSNHESDLWLVIEGELLQYDPGLQIGYTIYSEDGTLLYYSLHTDLEEVKWPKLKLGENLLKSRLPKKFLNEGVYRIELVLSLYYRQWLSEPGNNAPAIFLTIQGGLSDSPYWLVKRPGVLAPVLGWEHAAPAETQVLGVS